MAGTDPYLVRRLPDTTGLKNEVLIHRGQRNWYDQAVRTAGARLVEFGLPVDTRPYDLQNAVADRTVAVLYVVASFLPSGSLSLPETIEIAHRHDLPVVVDAAARRHRPALLARPGRRVAPPGAGHARARPGPPRPRQPDGRAARRRPAELLR